jgi:hypothetical protein
MKFILFSSLIAEITFMYWQVLAVSDYHRRFQQPRSAEDLPLGRRRIPFPTTDERSHFHPPIQTFIHAWDLLQPNR